MGDNSMQEIDSGQRAGKARSGGYEKALKKNSFNATYFFPDGVNEKGNTNSYNKGRQKITLRLSLGKNTFSLYNGHT
jgi:hypothetical protein